MKRSSSPDEIANNIPAHSIDVSRKQAPLKFPKETLPAMLGQSAELFSGKTALIYFGMKMTYSELFEQVCRCAAGLQALGLKKGERVALMMPNCPQFIIAYFGALKAGAIVTATSSMYTRREAAHQWHDAGISILIVEQQLSPIALSAAPDVPELRQIIVTGAREYYPKSYARLKRTIRVGRSKPERKISSPKAPYSVLSWSELLTLRRNPGKVPQKPGDIACLQYTGGTTGTSKGAMLTHANLVTNACQTRHWLSTGETSDVMVATKMDQFSRFDL